MATKAKKTTKAIKPEKEIFYKRFLSYYLGLLDGSTFNNATRSWLLAKGYSMEQVKLLSKPVDTDVAKEVKMVDEEGKEVKVIQKQNVYAPAYETARRESAKLLTIPHIVKLKEDMLDDMVKDIDKVKRRHAEIANQNKNLVVARQANADILKIHGALEDKQSIDIPQLNELTNKISDILKPKKK